MLLVSLSFTPRGCPPTPAHASPPRTENCDAGISGVGLAAYFASTCASIGNTAAASNPRTNRLYRSVSGDSISYRSPRFRVSLRVTFQSSWKYPAHTLELMAKSLALGTVRFPAVGMPYSREAKPCPLGATGELSNGPLV